MKFRYTARTKNGELQTGIVEGLNQDVAFEILTRHGLYILSIESSRNTIFDPLFNFFRRVNRTQLMVFTRQLSTMLEAGISLGDSLKALYNQTRNPILRETILEISLDVDSGLSFSQALERHGPIFSDFYISLVRTAEVTGRVEEATRYLADYLEKEQVLVSRIRNAMIYPALVIALFFVVAFILVVFVFPEIKSVLDEAGVKLPLITRVLLGAGSFLFRWWGVIVVALAVLISVAFDYFRSREGRTVLDQIFLNIPGIGRLLRKTYIARFSSAVSLLLRGGVPIAQAIEITGRNIGSATYAEVLIEVARGISQGEPLSTVLLEYPRHFPPLVVQMTAVGEATGKLETMLERVAAFYNREIDALIGELVELIQPIIMIVIGVFVGLLFASILLPIYDLAGKGF